MNKNISFTNFHISAIPCDSSFAYKNVRGRSNQAVTDFVVRFSDFAEKISRFSYTLIYIASRFLGCLPIFCRRLNFTNFSVKQALFSSTATRFAFPYPHLTQWLQDLSFRSLIWFKSYKICPSVASFGSSPTRFTLPYPHLAQILQDLPFRSLIWFKSYKICPSVASFGIYKNFFKPISRSIFKQKTALQILYSNNLNYFLIS